MANISSPCFSPATFKFLEQLKKNNDRTWFNKNKSRYEEDVREPSLAFIRAMRPLLAKISTNFVAIDKKVGGSLMRVYRDTRFAKDKTPYKTNIGIHFRHQLCGDVHAPGYYLHIEPRESFMGVGIWRPEPDALRGIRCLIDAQPTRYKRARDSRAFAGRFELAGDRLKTAPRDFPKDHPLIDDLRRKDFIGVAKLSRTEVLADTLAKDVAAAFKAANPWMRFLSEAVGVPF